MWFARDSTIIDVGGVRNPPAGGRWVLWPAWCWRVLAPDLTERRLNTFMRVVARLCQAGVSEPTEMAALTRLHPDLCRQVLLMLRQRRFVDRHGTLTKPGREALAGEVWDASRLRVVHVFQDPFDEVPGRPPLWPATREQLAYANVDYRPDGRPLLRPDSRRDSPSVLPVVADGRAVALPRQPSPESIINAGRVELSSGAAEESAEHPPRGQVARVSFIAEQPDPVLLMTYVYLPEDAVTSADWETLDPFSGWPNAWLKESLRARMPHDRHLATLVAEIEGTLAPADAAARQSEYVRLRAEAAVQVERRLGAWIHEPPYRKVFELLTEVEADIEDARLLGGIGGRRRQAAVNNAGKVLEHVFVALSTRYPLTPARVEQLRSERFGPDVLKYGLREARDVLGITSPLPGGLQRQSSDQVARASGGYLPSLRPAIVAALLASVIHTKHPLRTAIRHRPDLCDRLDWAAGMRNEGAHHQDREPTTEQADELLDLIYWTVSQLFTHPTTSE